MSNARNLANLLGTATTIQTAKIADSAITSAKITDGTIATDDLSVAGNVAVNVNLGSITVNTTVAYSSTLWLRYS